MQIKRKLYSLALTLGVLGLFPGTLSANYFDNGCCFNNIHVGGDFLYWQPCVSDNDYAIKADEPISTFSNTGNNDSKTHYLDCEWAPGYRAWIKVDDLFCGFNAAIIYSYFDHSTHDSVHGDLHTIVLSRGIPVDFFEAGNRVNSKWNLTYHDADLILGYPLQFSCNECFGVEAFSGIKFLKFTQDRHDRFRDDSADRTIHWDRDLDFWGIGPTLGVKTQYDFCGGFRVFGLTGASLMIGQVDQKDDIESIFGGFTETDQTYKNDDDCICFPGFHFLSGIAYETCWCNMQFSIHVGWEYVQWINAPSYPCYESDLSGIRSGNSEKNLSLQGVFAGVDIRF